MTITLVRSDLDVSLDVLEDGVDQLLSADLDQLSAQEELVLVGRLEQLRRRLEAAYLRGDIPVAHVRAITRVASNPRVAEHLPGADPIFAHQASVLPHDDFLAVLRQWEALADSDGADHGADECHERRRVGLLESAVNGSWSLEGSFGAFQGAAMAEVFEQFERAELLADWLEARHRVGQGAVVGDLARTPAQRRADALFAIFRRAASSPAGGRPPEPLVNIVIDQQTFEEQLRRAAGETVDVDPGESLGRRSHTVDGTPPSSKPSCETRVVCGAPGRGAMPTAAASKPTTGSRPSWVVPRTSTTPTCTAGSTTASKNGASNPSARPTATGGSIARTVPGRSRHPSDPLAPAGRTNSLAVRRMPWQPRSHARRPSARARRRGW